jgi:hypothetical protein
MYDVEDVQRLKRRYDLRAAGAELRDMVDDYELYPSWAILNDATHKMAKKDRLFFRQGFLFQAGVNNGS